LVGPELGRATGRRDRAGAGSPCASGCLLSPGVRGTLVWSDPRESDDSEPARPTGRGSARRADCQEPRPVLAIAGPHRDAVRRRAALHRGADQGCAGGAGARHGGRDTRGPQHAASLPDGTAGSASRGQDGRTDRLGDRSGISPHTARGGRHRAAGHAAYGGASTS
jgi:hypothetical protein